MSEIRIVVLSSANLFRKIRNNLKIYSTMPLKVTKSTVMMDGEHKIDGTLADCARLLKNEFLAFSPVENACMMIEDEKYAIKVGGSLKVCEGIVRNKSADDDSRKMLGKLTINVIDRLEDTATEIAQADCPEERKQEILQILNGNIEMGNIPFKACN